MSTTATTEADLPQDVLERAMQLSPLGREKLGTILLESVRDEAAARDLIRTRIAQLVSGEVELLNAEDVVADLEREFGKENAP